MNALVGPSEASLTALGLSARSARGLLRLGIKALNDINSFDESQLLKVQGLGRKSVDEILDLQKRLPPDDSRTGDGLGEPAPDDVISYGELRHAGLSRIEASALVESGLNTKMGLIKLDRVALKELTRLDEACVDRLLALKSQLLSMVMLSKDELLVIEKVILGEVGDLGGISSVREGALDLLQGIASARDALGVELAVEVYTQPDYARALIKSMRDFISEVDWITSMIGLLQFVPETRRNTPLHPYIDLLSQCQQNAFCSIIRAVQSPIIRLADLEDVLDVSCKDSAQRRAVETLIAIAATDLESVIGTSWQYACARLRTNAKDAVEMRSAGSTLEAIADQIGVTRERVRQIEKKAMSKLAYEVTTSLERLGLELIPFALATTGGSSFLQERAFRDMFSCEQLANIAVRLAKQADLQGDFTYSSERRAWYQETHLKDMAKIKKSVSQMPTIVPLEQMHSMILEVTSAVQLPHDLVEHEVKQIYRELGRFYVRGAIFLTDMYSYILRAHYPSGIRLYDAEEIALFRERLSSAFGAVSLPESDRAIGARLSDVAVLCDRGTCIHPDLVYADTQLVEDIYSYISGSDRNAISYHELYEVFRHEILKRSSASNRYGLQGVLRLHERPGFTFTKDLIAKDEGGLVQEIERFISETGRVHKSKVMKEFAGITDAMFLRVASTNSNILTYGDGYYEHAGSLDIVEEDYSIRELIRSHVAIQPVSARKLFDLMWQTSADFLTRNRIETHSELFAVLRHMFSEEFTFSRPFIAQLGSSDLTNSAIIVELLRSRNSISLSDLVLLCAEHHLKIQSVKQLLKYLEGEFLRVDSDELTRVDSIDETSLVAIAQNVSEQVSRRGFLSLIVMRDFYFFPDIGLRWNGFLLRSILDGHLSDHFSVLDCQSSDIYAQTAIILPADTGYYNYEEFLRSVVRQEHKKRCFASQGEMLEWIVEEGLCLSSPPSFARDEGFFLDLG